MFRNVSKPSTMIGAIALFGAILQGGHTTAAPFDARSLGLGRTQLALKGNAAMAWTSPALLGLPSGQATIMSVAPNLNLGLGNNALSFSAIDGLVSGNTLSDADVASLLAGIPESGFGLQLDLGATWGLTMPALYSGAFARASLDTAGVNLPKDMFKFLLQGNANSNNLAIDSLKGTRVDAFADAGVSFAIPFELKGTKAAAIGITGRYIQALGLARVTDAQGYLLKVNDDGSYTGNASLTYQYAYAMDASKSMGTGTALDLSFATDVRDDLRFVCNLSNIGAVHWSNVTEKSINYHLDFKPDITKLAPPELNPQTTSGPNDQKDLWDPLPLKVGLGTQWKPMRSLPLELMADFELGTARGYGVSTVPEVHVGGEYRPWGWLPLRIGMGLGGDRAAMFSAGIGWDTPMTQIDLAFGSFNGIFAGSKGGYYALSSQIKF